MDAVMLDGKVISLATTTLIAEGAGYTHPAPTFRINLAELSDWVEGPGWPTSVPHRQPPQAGSKSPVMIRPATLEDRDAAISLMRAARLATGFDSADGPSGFMLPFVAAYADRLFRRHLGDDTLAIVVDVGGRARGLLLAIAAEHQFGPVRIAAEVFWYIEPAFRRGGTAARMLDAYAAWSKAQHCAFMTMATPATAPGLALLYRSRGFKPAESHFIRAV